MKAHGQANQVTLGRKACRHRHERRARRQAGRQTETSSDQEGAYPGTCPGQPGRWFRPHTFRNKLIIQTRVHTVECKVASARASASAVTRCIAPGSVHCSVAHCPDGEHRPYLISGARAQGNCHLNYREYPGTVSSLSRGDRGFNGPDFPRPRAPAHKLPPSLATGRTSFPCCAFPSSPAKTGRPIINLFPFPLVPPRLCTHSPTSGTHRNINLLHCRPSTRWMQCK